MMPPTPSIMTPKKSLVTVKESASHKEVKELLHKHRIEDSGRQTMA
ncbi:MAG: hypothetical protein R3F26_00150 [Gammaproteobacteria bacterium]